MTLSDIEERIQKFNDKTKESFHFLESEYGYTRHELERKGFEYHIREAQVIIRYFSEKIAVEIIWAIGENALAVSLYELQNGIIPEKVSFYGHKGFAKAINLDSLVRMLTDGKINTPLPELTPNISFAEIDRRFKKSAELLETNMSEILEILAERLKKFGSDILKGDTSIFPKVQEHHRKYWEVEI